MRNAFLIFLLSAIGLSAAEPQANLRIQNSSQTFFPTNILKSNLVAGANITITYLSNGIASIAATAGSGDAGGTNARQWGTLSLTNASGNPNLATNILGAGTVTVTSNNAGVFTITGAGGGGITTNANQFGVTANGQLTLKDGVRITNAVNVGDFTADGYYNPAFLGDLILITDATGEIIESSVFAADLAYLPNIATTSSDVQNQLFNGTNNTATASNNIRAIMVSALTNKVENIAGSATNLTAQGLTVNTNLLLQTATASRPAIFDSLKQLTNAAGTPDGTKFLRDDGVLAVPAAAATAGGFSGAIQFNESAAIAGTNDLNWDRTNLVLNMKGVLSSTLNAAPSNSLATFTASTNDYLQISIRNSSSGSGAEGGFTATADTGTELAGFGWFGINSSTFSAVRAYSLGLANDVTFIGSGNDMEFGNANTNRDMIFSMGTAGTPFWQERMRLKSTTQGGALGVTAGLSASNAWVGGRIMSLTGQAFTNINSIGTLTNLYTNSTAIAGGMLTNNGDAVICEWVMQCRRMQPATNRFQIVYGSEIPYDTGNIIASNGMMRIQARITRTAASGQMFESVATLPQILVTQISTNADVRATIQSNWIATPIALRGAAFGPMAFTNLAFRMYYEPATR